MKQKPHAPLVLLSALLVLVAGASSLAYAASADWRAAYVPPPSIPYPEDDAYSSAKAELGRMLFFEQRLSGPQNLSCASCHNPELAWGDGLKRAIGSRGTEMPLRSPTLLDVAWTKRLGWDGKFRDLESVGLTAISGPANMDLPEAALVARLAADPRYVSAFAAAFADRTISPRNIGQALATYERGIVSPPAPFDRWMAGDEQAVSPAAKRGAALFNGRAHCAACHSGWAFTDGSFHDIGTAVGDDIGRGRLFPSSVALRYAFKTPTLRDVARRGPYMHDGSVPSLDAVIALYDRGGLERPSRDPLVRPLGLSAAERSDLVAFLQTLTATQAPLSDPARPYAGSQ